MRALVICVAVSVLLQLSSTSSSPHETANSTDDKRPTRQLFFPPSPLNPFYSTPIYNKTVYNGQYNGQFDQRYDVPHTLHLSPQEGITVIPNSLPNLGHVQQHQQHSQLRGPTPQAHLRPPQAQHVQQQQQLQYQQAQYAQQLQQAQFQQAQLQQAQLQQTQYQQTQLQQAQLQAHQSTVQPFLYPQPTPAPYQNIYSTPTPQIYSNSLYDIPAQQYPNLIDQGFYKYPVYMDPNMASAFNQQTTKPMFMKKRTIQELCAAYAPEEKTVIYVLSQNPNERPEEIEVPHTPTPTKPSKPEVFFVKYNTPEEADLAQKHIQAQYDALGGISEHNHERVSPITTAQEIITGARNVTRIPYHH